MVKDIGGQERNIKFKMKTSNFPLTIMCPVTPLEHDGGAVHLLRTTLQGQI